MSTFRNVSPGTLFIQGFLRDGAGTLGVGATKYVNAGETFDGSNYYYRFTREGMIANGIDAVRADQEAILVRTVDDGIPFSDSAGNVPNNPRVYHVNLAAGNSQILDFSTDLGGPAIFMNLDTTEDIYVYLNGNLNARVDVGAGNSLSFAAGEILLSSVTISNTVSGAGPAVIQVIVANIA